MTEVELLDLRKRFSGKVALDGLCLTIRPGELVTLLGPSGCGKTTTLRILAGFERPDSGTVRVGGQDVGAIPANRRGMGVVFQNYALFPHLSAFSNIAFGMKTAGRPAQEVKRRVPELLELVGLRDSGPKYPHQMSGGQQQRIALARALAIEPKVLLLDEPLSALDAVVRASLRDEIRRIQTALGMTTLYVTHDQEEALAISDRVIVMRDGRIEQEGSAEEIYAKPASRFVAGFIGKMNQMTGQVADPLQGHVRCGPHLVRVPPASLAGLGGGDVVTVLIRPEAVSVEPAATGAAMENAFHARVETLAFLGSVRRLNLDIGGQRLVADISAAAVGLRHGDQVKVSWSRNACRVLAEPGDGDPHPPPVGNTGSAPLAKEGLSCA